MGKCAQRQERVKQRFKEVQSGLPEGVEVVITYDRSDLIQRAINTLKHTLIEEMIVVSLIIFAFATCAFCACCLYYPTNRDFTGIYPHGWPRVDRQYYVIGVALPLPSVRWLMQPW